MPFPFEVPFSEIRDNPEVYVDAVFSCLESEFLVLPKGSGFVDYPTFETAYEQLKRLTGGFTVLDPVAMAEAVRAIPLGLVVLRTMLGFTPPEWAYLATLETEVTVTQGWARSVDRRIRLDPLSPLPTTALTTERVQALVDTACRLLAAGADSVEEDRIHRLGKADTQHGLESLQAMATLGVPYAMLLYERFLGRPFAGHRDSVSELIGDELEQALERVLDDAGVSFRKTRRAERVPGFDQAPDFLVPSEFNPQVVIECKITEDDGTARDKVTRIQHLSELSGTAELPEFETIACIGGRGFGVRREDMRKLLSATRGKVFTLRTLDRVIDHTRLREFRTR